MGSSGRLGRFVLLTSVLAGLASLTGCHIGPEAVAAPAVGGGAVVMAAPVSSAPKVVAVAPAPVSAVLPKRAAAGAQLELPTNVAWQGWDAGLARAKAENKPVMLLVWAHWCPRCRELAPTFGDPEVAALAEKMVMVEQNADERPGWLSEKFDSLYGGYVPRVFVLRPDGTVRTDITSGNPEYPYFYVPHNKAALVESLKKALRG